VWRPRTDAVPGGPYLLREVSETIALLKTLLTRIEAVETLRRDVRKDTPWRRSRVQYDAQQSRLDLDTAVVVDKAKLSEICS